MLRRALWARGPGLRECSVASSGLKTGSQHRSGITPSPVPNYYFPCPGNNSSPSGAGAHPSLTSHQLTLEDDQIFLLEKEYLILQFILRIASFPARMLASRLGLTSPNRETPILLGKS